ncbi:MAG: hypothetical protein K2G69_01835 [Muribaculaceae bacterium]|nr:hypothetical protein [Muribaculaceae bacterium]
MKRSIFVFLSFPIVLLGSCGKDDASSPKSDLEENYISIEGAEFVNSNLPTQTTTETIQGVEMSDQVMNGAINYITVSTEQQISEFYLGIQGVEGYWAYDATKAVSRVDAAINSYVIPVMISQNMESNITMTLNGRLINGDVTTPVRYELHYLATREGTLEIKLSFNNEKDIDLHLITPSGYHIYYANRGGDYEDEEESEISFGLDVDSNAGCDIDGINKENIYIPAELIEDGVYKVIVDMYSNCNPSIPTNWSVVARYNGNLLTPLSGRNPASGIYPVGAEDDDMTEVMSFRLTGTRSVKTLSLSDIVSSPQFLPRELRESDKWKLGIW